MRDHFCSSKSSQFVLNFPAGFSTFVRYENQWYSDESDFTLNLFFSCNETPLTN